MILVSDGGIHDTAPHVVTERFSKSWTSRNPAGPGRRPVHANVPFIEQCRGVIVSPVNDVA
jgi:hypothetical protein